MVIVLIGFKAQGKVGNGVSKKLSQLIVVSSGPAGPAGRPAGRPVGRPIGRPIGRPTRQLFRYTINRIGINTLLN